MSRQRSVEGNVHRTWWGSALPSIIFLQLWFVKPSCLMPVVDVKLISNVLIYVLNAVHILQQLFPTFPLSTSLICSPVSLNTNNHKLKKVVWLVYMPHNHVLLNYISFFTLHRFLWTRLFEKMHKSQKILKSTMLHEVL